ncbi:hypothetical protein CSKR_110694 [Clonorchis sinensis]|uniref:TAP-C domain-containing protein n=2 Tax=Clonorchis sinensis TaxID=79923 RepID=A0A8T1M132_CLOSI|nr:hypothetical protein CSKR_110694 [Clonorchis sinensis]
MGRRRGRSGRKSTEHQHVEPDDVIDPDVCLKLSKRLRRQRRKVQKKCERLQFAAACEDALMCREQPTLMDLPPTIHSVPLDPELLTSLSVLVTSYLDAFETGDLRKRLIDFYVPDAYLTLQITPYLCIHDDVQSVPTKREKLKAQPSWAGYERFAVNLIPGAVPLPAWAWASLCTAVATGPKSEQSRQKLGKYDRQRLKVLRAFQAAHSQRLKNVSRSASSASDRWLESIPLPPLARREAMGHADIQGLLSRLPDLIHVKADECCCLDVISAETTAICFRYYCLAAETIPSMATTDVDLPGCRDQILEVLPYGRVFVRGVHRCLLVLPQSEGKIIQEDCCITPVSASLVQQHAAAIRLAVTQRLNRRLSNNPAPKPTDPAVQAALRELSVTTGMNEAYAWQCLSECGFNLHAALEAFRNVMEANLLPPEAFAK